MPWKEELPVDQRERFIGDYLRKAASVTELCGRYTQDRRENFDIYLPLWLARHNKTIFGTLYGVGVIYTLLRWSGVAG